MQKLVLAGLMVVGAAFPVMARDVEVTYKDIAMVRIVAGENSYGRDIADDELIKDSLLTFCNAGYSGMSEDQMDRIVVRSAIKMNMTPDRSKVFFSYMATVKSVAKEVTCPDAFQQNRSVR